MTERERLAADLELLGILADPTRGPLASLYSPACAPIEPKVERTFPGELWRRCLAAVAKLQKVRLGRPPQATPYGKSIVLPTH